MEALDLQRRQGEVARVQQELERRNALERQDDECPICFDLTPREARYLAPCLHWACVPCMREHLVIKPTCPICNTAMFDTSHDA